MYELLIKDKNGVWQRADLGDDVPAINYQSNDISELKNRNLDYSQALKLPLTNNNIKIFDFANEPDVITEMPYSRIDCRLFCNGYTLAGKGSYMILDRVTQFFETQILSGSADFFQLLKDSDVKDLDLGYYTRDNNLTEAFETYRFGAATFVKGGYKQRPGIGYVMNPELVYPFVKLKNVIEKIVSRNGQDGFTFMHNLTGQWENKALSLAETKPSNDSFTAFTGAARATSRFNGQAADFEVISNEAGNITVNDLGQFHRRVIRYKVPTDGSFTITINSQSPVPEESLGYVFISNGDDINNAEIIHEFFTYSGNVIEKTIELFEGDTINVEIIMMMVEPFSFLHMVYFDNIVSTSDSVQFGGKVYLAPNLGFNTQLDLFKAFLQIFGLTVRVDNVKKIVYAYTMDKLYENKAIAKDWTSKYHNGGNGYLSFVVRNYATKNNILFEDNSEDNVTDKGTFIIRDNTLEREKDLFTIGIQAGLENRVFSDILDQETGSEYTRQMLVANIPLLEYNKDDNTYTFKGSKSHLVELSERYKFLLPDDSYIPVANHVKAQYLIDTFYDKLVNKMLVRDKTIEEQFLLTDQDIEEFDQFTPIYLHQYGAYFYVNKIKNYISGQLTTVELIRL